MDFVFLCYNDDISLEFAKKVYIEEIKTIKSDRIPMILIRIPNPDFKKSLDISYFKNEENFVNDYEISSFYKVIEVESIFKKCFTYFYQKELDKNSTNWSIFNLFISKLDPKLVTVTNTNLSKGFKGYMVNFYSIFTQKKMEIAFEEFLITECNPQPLKFILETKKMEGMTKNDDCLLLFQNICKRFILKNSMDEINIRGEDRKNVIEIYNSIDFEKGVWTPNITPLEVLKKAINEIMNDLQGEVWPRFLNSNIAYKTIESLKDDQSVITKDPKESIKKKIENMGRFLTTEKKSSINNNVNITNESLHDFFYQNLINHEKYRDLYLVDEFKNQKVIDICKSMCVFHKDYHYILGFGELLFEWNEKEICLPRKQKLEGYEIIPLKITNLFSWNLDKIAKKIWTWNCYKSYVRPNPKRNDYIKSPNFGTSKDFVASILFEMNIDFN